MLSFGNSVHVTIIIVIANVRCRGVDVENAIKLAAADDGFVTYEEIRENLRK